MNQDLQQVEISIEEAKFAIAQGDALKRLYKNPDFKLVILESLFRDYSVGQVMSLASPATQTPQQQAEIQHTLRGISETQMFLQRIFQNASIAKQAMEADLETREEILNEEME